MAINTFLHNNQMSTCSLAQAFHVFSTTILSLLLPLSFNILARLTNASHHLLSSHSNPPYSFLFTFLFNINPKFLYVLLFIITFEALIRVLIDKINLQIDLQPRGGFHPRVCSAWFFLVALQVSLGLGIQGNLEAGVGGGVGSGEGRNMISKVILLVGLHEVMLCWCSSIVRPTVVDGLVFGEAYVIKEWVERCSLAACFGWWWWKLGHEVESLVVGVEAKRNIMEVELSELIGWWLYCMTLLVGVFRIAKGVLWIVLKSWRWGKVVGWKYVCLREDEEKV